MSGTDLPETDEPTTLPGTEPTAPTEPTPPAGDPPAPAEPSPEQPPPEPEPLSALWRTSVRRSEVAALRARGLTPRQIAARLGVVVWAVQKALRTPAPLAKCASRKPDPALAG